MDGKKHIEFLVPQLATAQADGSILVRPGRPIPKTWLTAKELADVFGRSPGSVYRWREEGIIPERCVRFAGLRNILFSPEVIQILKQRFEESHGE